MCWNPKYAVLIFTSTLITYLSGILISHSNTLSDKVKKILAACGAFFVGMVPNVFAMVEMVQTKYGVYAPTPVEKGSIIEEVVYHYTTVIEIDSQYINRDENNNIISINEYIIKDNFVILDIELNFIELDNCNADKLYASLKLDHNYQIIPNEIVALYAYNPRIV